MQIFYSIQVNGKTVDWERLSGYALGVQKYTKTHVSGGGENSSVSYKIETIIEFDIKQNAKEVHVQISSDRIRVRDGQKVSVLSCYNKTKCYPNCIFINHESREWHWLCGYWIFFTTLGIFSFIKSWTITNLILGGIWLITLFLFAPHGNELIQTIFICLTLVGVVSFTTLFIVMKIVLSSAWGKMQSQVDKMVRYIM